MENSISGRSIVIVGGGTGIGAAIAKSVMALGASVVIGGRRTEILETLCGELRAKFDGDPSQSGGSIKSHVIDVGDDASVNAFFEFCDDSLGCIDVMVNCAGINVANRTMAAMDPPDFERVLNINTVGAYRCLRNVLPGMRARGGGLIIQISSVAGKRALELGGVAYCASKFAMTAMGTAASNEVRGEGVRITNVYPGEVNTPLLDQRPVAVSQQHRDSILQPEDVAAVVTQIIALPPRAHVPEIVIKPTIQHWM